MSKPNKKSAGYYQKQASLPRFKPLTSEQVELDYAYTEVEIALNKALKKIWKKTGKIFTVWAHSDEYPRFLEEVNPEERFSRPHPDYCDFSFNLGMAIFQDVKELEDFNQPVPNLEDYSERDLAMLGPEEIKALKGDFSQG